MAEAPDPPGAARWPVATAALAALLCAVYGAGALRQGQGPGALTSETLLALGALRLPLQGAADLPRLLSSLFVHVDPQHLATNVALLLGLGAWPGRLEARLGAGPLLLQLLLAGLGGALASLLAELAGGPPAQAPTLVAGASGALCGLAAAAVASPGPRALRLGAAAALLFLLGAGLALGDRGAGAAHLGGAAAGLALRALLRGRFQAWAGPRLR